MAKIILLADLLTAVAFSFWHTECFTTVLSPKELTGGKPQHAQLATASSLGHKTTEYLAGGAQHNPKTIVEDFERGRQNSGGAHQIGTFFYVQACSHLPG